MVVSLGWPPCPRVLVEEMVCQHVLAFYQSICVSRIPTYALGVLNRRYSRGCVMLGTHYEMFDPTHLTLVAHVKAYTQFNERISRTNMGAKLPCALVQPC